MTEKPWHGGPAGNDVTAQASDRSSRTLRRGVGGRGLLWREQGRGVNRGPASYRLDRPANGRLVGLVVNGSGRSFPLHDVDPVLTRRLAGHQLGSAQDL